MIGQFGKFDKRKQERDYRDDFFGIEACLFETQEDIEILKKVLDEYKISLGVHFPLRAKQWRLRDPQYLSLNEGVVLESYDFMTQELQYISIFKPHYILLHYPKPVIIDDRVDWSNWRFSDKTEYHYETEYSYDEFIKRSRTFFKWLSQQGLKHYFIPVLEIDVVNKYIYDTNLLEELLYEFDNIKLCLDIGRLHLQEMIDKNFDSFKFVKRYAKYAEVIHLWDVKVTSNVENSHYPVSPKHSVTDGWADIEKYMEIIREENKACKILFEHRSDLISDKELDECYEWIDELV